MQLQQWTGDFGNQYIERCPASEDALRSIKPFWRDILGLTKPGKILEVGANIGINLRAIAELTDAELFAIEPNARARTKLIEDGVVHRENVRGGSAQSIDFRDGVAELVFTSGVLIHISPDDLLQACKEIHRCSSRYIGCIEYFSDKPEMIHYRGHDDLLFKRDFGAFWLDNFPDLKIVDHGFLWKRAAGNGQDNSNWWLFEKP